MYDYETADAAYYELLKAYSDYNKMHPTAAEAIMWDCLQSKRIGIKFRRQHIIKDYIVDFVNLQSKIVIEIDGQYHIENNQIVKDTSRTDDLQQLGYTVIRFSNEEVVGNTNIVLRQIKKTVMEVITPKSSTKTPPPSSPSLGGGWGEAGGPVFDAWAVDAACSGNPGPMEYQAIDLQTGCRVFHFGPMHGTNNIGEFLAIVHALALCWQQGLHGKTIYSDSYNAILWVRKRECKTKLERTPQTEPLYQIIARAEQWLRTHDYKNPVVKWETNKWGEVPADFGRKK